ncbi:lipopolysaccharide biosynthesis protein [Flavobacterium ardleyense]|uniref:Lipopolysaccharide biosynthesis protein n=1 Tax=Flavobacterium ardleyense TaxID=2038737 RepID=A0ABW5ZBE9_9FLAO
MGIVIKQSIRNTIITFLGFGIGAVNTLFMYPYFLGKEYFGITGYVLALANVLYPIMSFGIQNTLIKFFDENSKSDKELNSYITYMLLVPVFFIIPILVLFFFFYDTIALYESQENSVVYPFVWVIPIIAVFMGYFEIFYAWLRAHMKSVFGSFVKEVFVRILVSVLLFGVYFGYISPSDFIYSLVLVYGIALLLIVFYANKVRKIRLYFKTPKSSKAILRYTFFIILSGSIANMLLDIDKYMIKHYMNVENIAFYSVAIFIAMVISVPSRAMHQITYPITAKLINEGKWDELNALYKKSSITLQVVGGLLLIGILVNIKQLYLLLPPEYSQGLFVVFTIGLSKYFDLILGNNNAIIFNSKYYRAVLLLGLVLVVLIITLNLYFIPNYGLNGAAMATLISISLYSVAKLLFVVLKMKLYPFTSKTLVALAITGLSFGLFYYWEFSFHPIVNIILKSVLVSLLYVGLSYFLKISSDINYVINSFLKKLGLK